MIGPGRQHVGTKFPIDLAHEIGDGRVGFGNDVRIVLLPARTNEIHAVQPAEVTFVVEVKQTMLQQIFGHRIEKFGNAGLAELPPYRIQPRIDEISRLVDHEFPHLALVLLLGLLDFLIQLGKFLFVGRNPVQ